MKTIQRIAALALCLALVCTLLPGVSLTAHAETYSGSCGENLTWSFDTETGLLNIEGSGAMKDYASYSDVPWYAYRESITSLRIVRGVTNIGAWSFCGCENLAYAEIPASVTSIGHDAFAGCTALECVSFLAEEMESIGNGAFASTALTSVEIPYGVETIPYGVFYNCKYLERVTLPVTVTSLGQGVFSRCISLKNVMLPESLTSIGMECFQFCSALPSIVIPAGVESIGNHAFDRCDLLSSVLIRDGVKQVGNYAFTNCSLDCIVIPASVESIGEYAFGYKDGWDGMSSVKDFVVCGCEGTAAQAYAEANGFRFLLDRVQPVAERLLADGRGNGYVYNELYTEEMYNDYWGWIDEQWAYTVKCICDYVDFIYGCDDYASLIGRETYAEIAANEGLKIAYAMRIWNFCQWRELDGRMALVDHTGTFSWDLVNSFPTMDDFVAVTKIAYHDDPVEFFGTEATGKEGVSIVDYAFLKLSETYSARAFFDVPVEAYYYAPVNWAVAHTPQITAGMDAIRFGSNNNCTREQIVTFLWAANGKPEPEGTGTTFSDVSADAWYYKPVAWAVENGITSGMGDGSFGVGQSCTRAQAMTFLWAAKGKPAPETATSPFSDVSEGDWYYDAVLWAYENEVTAGMGDGSFGANSTCTRAQIITFLYKAYVTLQESAYIERICKAGG